MVSTDLKLDLKARKLVNGMSLASISVQFGSGLMVTTYPISNTFENFAQHPMENGVLCRLYVYLCKCLSSHEWHMCTHIDSMWSIDFC